MCYDRTVWLTRQLFSSIYSLMPAGLVYCPPKASSTTSSSSNMNTLFMIKKRRNVATSNMDLLPPPALPSPPIYQLHGNQILHFSHPQHPLLRIAMPYLFTCMGCKEYGAGIRFRCQTCGFDLHDFCALAPPVLQSHPLHHKHQLAFVTKPGGFLRSKCDVCGKAAKGFAFGCTQCSFEMHPCCAAMRAEMTFVVHEHPLVLSSPPSSDACMGCCRVCQRKRSGLLYRCSVAACGFCLHAVCAKDMVNGLYVHGFRSPEKPNKLGAAARMATHALFGIIGGLIEGIGEGIGEALIDNVARGTVVPCTRRRDN